MEWRNFKKIEYSAKDGFDEVHKATWFGYYDCGFSDEKMEFVLKRLYNSSDNILDILKRVRSF